MAMQLVERPTGAMVTVRVTAAPFHSFTQIAAFQKSVANLHGVKEVRIQSARKGILVLDVDYNGLVPLHTRLREMRDIRWTPVQMANDAVEIAVA